MSKLSFALSSLVAVVPAAFMMYLLVMGFISGMPTILMVMAGAAMVCGVGIALFPILSFIIGPKAEAPTAVEETSQTEETIDEFEDFGEDGDLDDFDEEISDDDEWADFEA